MPENDKALNKKDLQEQQSGAYKPAYKNNPKIAENQEKILSDDLAEIVQIWSELPEHIKAAINLIAEAVELDMPVSKGIFADQYERLDAFITLYNIRPEQVSEEKRSWESDETKLEKVLKNAASY